MKRLLAGLALLLALGAPAPAQQCPTRPTADSTNACASTAFVHNNTALLNLTCPAHQFVNVISASGPTCAQPAVGDLQNVAADSILGNFTGGSAAPSTQAVPNCSAGQALSYSTSTHSFSCVTALPTISNNQVLANTSGSSAQPVGTNATTWFDSAYCNTIGSLIARTTGSWTCAQGIPINVEWFGVLPGNSAATNSANFASICTAINAKTGNSVLFPNTGYNFNAILCTLTKPVLVSCGYVDDPTVNGNIRQSSATNIFVVHTGYFTFENCSTNGGSVPILIGDDAVRVTTGNVIVSGNAQITCTACTFTSADVGKQFTCISCSAGPSNLLGTIATFVDATHVTVSPTPGNSITNTTLAYGFNYQEIVIRDAAIYNYTGNGVKIVSATQFHIDHLYTLGADPISIQNIIWADQGDGEISNSTLVANTAGAHNTITQNSGGGLRIVNNKILAQAAITNCIEINWAGTGTMVGSVGPFILDNSIEGSCTNGITVDGSNAAVPNGGIIGQNEIGIASAGTALALNPTTTHPNWTVSNNLVRQSGGGSAFLLGNMSNFQAWGNNVQNVDANGTGIVWNIGAGASGTINQGTSAVTNMWSGGSSNISIDSVQSTALASIPTAANGSRFFCSNCNTATSPCTSGGTGAFVSRQNSALKCF